MTHWDERMHRGFPPDPCPRCARRPLPAGTIGELSWVAHVEICVFCARHEAMRDACSLSPFGITDWPIARLQETLVPEWMTGFVRDLAAAHEARENEPTPEPVRTEPPGEFTGIDVDFALTLTRFGVGARTIAEIFETDRDGVNRLLARGWLIARSARGPCEVCNGTIRRDGRRRTCSPGCVRALRAERWEPGAGGRG